MCETYEIDSITFDLIADVVGKWSAVFAGEFVRAYMVTSFLTND
jgi:hypothetical protein